MTVKLVTTKVLVMNRGARVSRLHGRKFVSRRFILVGRSELHSWSIEFFPATFGWKELDCGNENKRVKK